MLHAPLGPRPRPRRFVRLGIAFSLAATVAVSIGTAAEAAPVSSGSVASAEFRPVEVTAPDGQTVVNVTPARFLETRSGLTTVDGKFQGVGKRDGGSQLRVQIAGRGVVPADAEGVVVNVTAVEPVANGFITVHPCVTPRPVTSSLNYQGGVNLGNEIVSALAADGSVCVFTRTTTHITLDVVGYVPAGSSLTATAPARFFETRAGLSTVDGQFAGVGPTSAGGTVKIKVAGRGVIPTGITSVIANVTAVNPGLNGFLTAHGCLASPPPTSSLNYRAGVNRGNELVIPVDANGDICIFTLRGIDLTVDVLGYVPPGTNLTSIIGARLVETRPGLATVDGKFAGIGQAAAESQLRVKIAGRAGIPSDATGVILNLTAVVPTAQGFISVHPCVDPRPTASSLNHAAGVTGGNEIIAGLNASGELCVFTKRATDFTLDVTGYLSPVGADLSVTKTDAADPVTPGSTVTYTVTVANAGPRPAADVVATDTLPSGLTFVSTNGCDEDPAGVPTCSLGTIPAGGSAQYTITTTSTTAKAVTNTVTVDTSTGDPNPANNTATETTTVNDAPVITSSANRNVAENTKAAGTLTATDQFVPAQTLTWSETGGADASKLSISAGGVLTFDTAPDFENPTDANTDNVYVINVRVSDGAGGVANQTVRVTVTNVNEAPVITSSDAPTAPENQTAVATLTATDPEAQPLTWSETGGADAGKLSITSGGVLTFDDPPDFETPTDANADNVYVINVRVSDGTNNTNQTVRVTVTFAAGTIFVVTSTANSGAGTLRQAMQNANATPGEDTITFDLASPSTIALTNNITITDDVRVEGPGRDALTVTNPTSRVFDVDAGSFYVDSLTIDGAGSNGIIVTSPGESVTLYDMAIRDSVVHGLNVESAASVTVTDSFFTNARAPGSKADGVHAENVTGPILIEDVVATGNDDNFEFRNISGTVTLRRVTSTNSVDEGGDFQMIGGLVIESSLFDLNGDQVEVDGVSGSLSITDSTFTRTGTDDALEIVNASGSATVSRSTLSGNSVGGLEVWGPTAVTVVNSTISGNGTSGIIAKTGSTVTVRHSTIVANGGRGINVLGGTVSVTHTILTGNTGPAIDVSGGGSASIQYSLVPTGSPLTGTGVIKTSDAKLGALANNGGPTQTHRPLAGSPAINAGNPAVSSPPATDQRGQTRVVGTIDIGSVEV